MTPASFIRHALVALVALSVAVPVLAEEGEAAEQPATSPEPDTSSDDVIQELEALGATCQTIRAPTVIGSVQAVVIDKRGHIQFGAADKRRIGGVVSVRRDAIAH